MMLTKADTAIVEYRFRDTVGGEFWIDIYADGEPWRMVGPFDDSEERQQACNDIMSMARQCGAKDLPIYKQ